jgi:hypothetical protein
VVLTEEAEQGETLDRYLSAMRQADGHWQFDGPFGQSGLSSDREPHDGAPLASVIDPFLPLAFGKKSTLFSRNG